MIFLNCVCGASESIELTPSYITNIDYVELKNGIYNDLYVSSDPDCGYLDAEGQPYIWNYDTILYAPFDGNTLAGNINFALDTISHVLIKRKVAGEFEWQTIYVKEIKDITDFTITGIDYTARSNVEYIYASVLIYNNGLEGGYSTATSTVVLDNVFLVGADRIVSTSITDGYCNTTRNAPSSVNVLLNNKYPIYIRNTIANYDSGSLSATYLERDEENCTLQLENDSIRTMYQKDVMDFLCDGNPKLLKHFDGRMWLIMVTGNPTDTADENYKLRRIDFEWTEIGDCESEEDLYYAGLIDVPEEWWS